MAPNYGSHFFANKKQRKLKKKKLILITPQIQNIKKNRQYFSKIMKFFQKNPRIFEKVKNLANFVEISQKNPQKVDFSQKTQEISEIFLIKFHFFCFLHLNFLQKTTKL